MLIKGEGISSPTPPKWMQRRVAVIFVTLFQDAEYNPGNLSVIYVFASDDVFFGISFKESCYITLGKERYDAVGAAGFKPTTEGYPQVLPFFLHMLLESFDLFFPGYGVIIQILDSK
jgi:hypothetical protein